MNILLIKITIPDLRNIQLDTKIQRIMNGIYVIRVIQTCIMVQLN